MATNYLTRSGATPTSEKKATMSAWVKLNDPAGSIGLFAQTASSSGNGVMFFINASSQLEFYATGGSSQVARVVTNRLLRDTSAWYLLQCQIDTTQASNINRVKMFINGEQIADGNMSTASYPSQNINLNGFDGSGNQIFGSLDNLSYNCKADVADVYFIDGAIIATTQFYETDATTGEIKPKLDPTISSFGANGYHLKFENANQGLDSKPSGATNFTTNGTIRKQEDNPSNNFATLNILDEDIGTSNTFSNGNNTLVTGGNGARSTLAAKTGKYYAEVKLTSGNGQMMGIQDMSNPITANTGTVLLLASGATLYVAGSTTSYGSAWSAGDIMQIAMDLDSGTKKVYFGKDGQWWNGSAFSAANPDTGTTLTGDFYGFRSDSGTGTPTADWNFGNGYFGTTAISSEGTNASGIGKFEYDVPTGYTALSTKGLNE